MLMMTCSFHEMMKSNLCGCKEISKKGYINKDDADFLNA